MTISPMLLAIDLVRIDIDQLGLADLNEHAVCVLNTIDALNAYINNEQPKSHNALLNAMRLNRKLALHMSRVRDLIQSRKLAQTVLQTAAAASASSSPQMPSKTRRSSVIRPLASADNAASGHI